MQIPHIPRVKQKRVVIVGSGFAGLTLAKKISKKQFQVVLIDKNNYYQFQPLLYQVATAGLEPSSISFPLRKVFQNISNIHIRVAEVINLDIPNRLVYTSTGEIDFDFLVLATGVDTNYYGNDFIAKKSFAMKSISEALSLRNSILQNLEDALATDDLEKMELLMNIVIVGGGATGVEVAGALAEMKKHILPKDYPEMDFNKMKIVLLQGSDRLLNGMSDISSQKAKEYLDELGVLVKLNTTVDAYDGTLVRLKDGSSIRSATLIWAAGVKGKKINGLSSELYNASNRLIVNQFNQVEGYQNIFALGDIAAMKEQDYPLGHPQVAQAAIQQAKLLSKNLIHLVASKPLIPFSYKNLGSLATVGRNLAVADFPYFKFQGFFAWIVWMFIHLMAIVGVKNRLMIFINWLWNYVTYDQSLRLIIKPKIKNDEGA